MRRAEFVMATVMGIFSLYLMWKSAELPIGWEPRRGPGGGAFPFWLSTGMLVCSIWIIVNWVRRTSPPSTSEEPYMDREELRHEIEDGVRFWGYEEDGALIGVMGIQDVQDVTLIRHAYVRTLRQGQGIGSWLLSHLRTLTDRPMLIGTWADADWAVRFYERHGFRLVTEEEKNRLLRKYWSIPQRQVETSVVLAEQDGAASRAGE